jgi:hypothetical protein
MSDPSLRTIIAVGHQVALVLRVESAAAQGTNERCHSDVSKQANGMLPWLPWTNDEPTW